MWKLWKLPALVRENREMKAELITKRQQLATALDLLEKTAMKRKRKKVAHHE